MNPLTYSPSSPAEFIGQAQKVAGFFLKLLADSQANGHTPVKVLLNGPPGVGKSELVKFLQSSAGIHPKFSTTKLNGTKVNMDTVADMEQSMHYRDLYGLYKLFWIDEADKIPSIAQVRFLTLLDDLPNGVAVVCTSNSKLKNFEDRFQSRFQYFEVKSPAPDEIETLVGRFIGTGQIARQIATFAAGNVRQALRDAEGVLQQAA